MQAQKATKTPEYRSASPVMAAAAGPGSAETELKPRPCVHRPPRSRSSGPHGHLTRPRDARAPRDPGPARRRRGGGLGAAGTAGAEDCGGCGPGFRSGAGAPPTGASTSQGLSRGSCAARRPCLPPEPARGPALAFPPRRARAQLCSSGCCLSAARFPAAWRLALRNRSSRAPPLPEAWCAPALGCPSGLLRPSRSKCPPDGSHSTRKPSFF